jgi:hypothetical protein
MLTPWYRKCEECGVMMLLKGPTSPLSTCRACFEGRAPSKRYVATVTPLKQEKVIVDNEKPPSQSPVSLLQSVPIVATNNSVRPGSFDQSPYPTAQQQAHGLGAAGTGIRHDSGKARISTLPGRAIEVVMQVGEFGAKKYGDHNYRGGMPVTKYLDAAYRHGFVEWLFKGKDVDPESGLSHLAHAAWNLLAALEQTLLKPELDNRYKEKGQ